MRKPLGFSILPLLLLAAGVSLASECPAGLSETCNCENLVEGFRIVCDRNSNLNNIMAALKGDSIDKLDIRNCHPRIRKLVSLPKLKVRSLTLHGCGIEKVAEKAFVNVASDLEELRLSNNSFSTMPFLGELPKLESLNLNNNQLFDVAENVFEGCPKLRHLRLKNNHICAMSRNALNETKNKLELLDLSGNCLAAVPAQNLRNAPVLKHLDLSANRISELAKFSFMNLPMLKELRLSSNRLTALSPLAFMNVPDLSHLYVRDNVLTGVETGTLQMFKKLEVIDLTHNAIIKIPSFKDLPNLKDVRLDHNQIRRIETMTFSANPALQIVNLQDNHISLIAKNSFDSLDQLTMLLLANNSLPSIEKGVFDGMKNLQQINLHNNSIQLVTNVSFASLPNLNVIDLSSNKLSAIQPGAFSRQTHMFWLDLSNNNLTTFEKGVFEHPITNIILDGNQFVCDQDFDWFVTYVVQHQVRTFIPGQPEIVCVGPPKYAGTRLKDLMLTKANDTIMQGIHSFGLGNGQNAAAQGGNFLANLLPLLSQQGGSGSAGNGLLGAITQAFPSMRTIPGLSPETRVGQTGDPNLDSAIEQFSEPLVRFSTGAQPVASDVQQLIKAIPNLVVNVPGFGNVDLSKVPPPILEHVLRGGQLPGIPRETLEAVIKKYTHRMYEAASRAQHNRALPDDSKFLPPLTTFPQQVINDILKGDSLPHVNPEEMNVIKGYYTQQIPIELKPNTSGGLNPQVFSMLNLLPPNYNFSKIPAEVMQAVMKGEMPDLNLLPSDVIEYLRANSDQMFKSFKLSPNMSIEEVLSKLPRFEPTLFSSTFTPYDINQVDSDLVVKSDALLTESQIRILTAVALSFFSVITVLIVGLFCCHLRKSRVAAQKVTPFPTPGLSGSHHLSVAGMEP